MILFCVFGLPYWNNFCYATCMLIAQTPWSLDYYIFNFLKVKHARGFIVGVLWSKHNLRHWGNLNIDNTRSLVLSKHAWQKGLVLRSSIYPLSTQWWLVSHWVKITRNQTKKNILVSPVLSFIMAPMAEIISCFEL